ncbi:hypothetical protein IPZ60_14035 [Psychrobacter sp. NG25]|uniref:hypothetical protein n=1 Tax=Psychrobacter sp. NG25 TaxID=2782005 RepID=UPI001883CB5A|nr:hypothetical protein [Psychrobacter sp. NG25]MBF0659861.1 hypothetical protein [Psychrobacter sp. NG25]
MKNLTLSLSLLAGAALTIPSLAMAVEQPMVQTATADTTMQTEAGSMDNGLQTETEEFNNMSDAESMNDMAQTDDGSMDDMAQADAESDGTVEVEEETAQPYL